MENTNTENPKVKAVTGTPPPEQQTAGLGTSIFCKALMAEMNDIASKSILNTRGFPAVSITNLTVNINLVRESGPIIPPISLKEDSAPSKE